MIENKPTSYASIFEAEYEALKAEQNVRIALRDNLIYTNLGVIGAVSYFAFANSSTIHCLLVVPWASFILGWTYFANDTKISQIRDYIQKSLAPNWFGPGVPVALLGWEMAHRKVPFIVRNKTFQLIVDLVAFALSGFAALVTYFYSDNHKGIWHYSAIAVGVVLVFVLASIFIYHYIKDIKSLKRAT